MTRRETASSARHQLLDAARRLLARAEEFARERGPLLRGAFQLRGTRCGKENCKCTQGELHTTAVLIVSEKGNRHSHYVRPPDRPEVQRRVERYLRFRNARAELGKLNAEILAAVDQLLESLLEPYSPQRDTTGPKRAARGPRSRKKP